MRINYTLSKSFQNAEFVRTGQRPEQRQTLDLDVAAATPEQRQAVIGLNFEIEGPIFGGVFVNRLGTPALATFGGGTQVRDLDSDHYLAADEAWAIIEDMAAKWPQVKAEAEAKRAEAEAQQKAIAEQRQRNREAADAKRQAEWDARDALVRTIAWREDGTALHDLYDALVWVSGVEQDSRYPGNWVKRITAVTQTENNGYDFQGEWVNEGTVELRHDTRAVYLVAGTSGSRKHHATTYCVVVLEDGALRKTAITTDDRNPGWALRIRDDVRALLSA